ncbi:S8 family peptidase [Marinicella meishanensis]|uniref:S8 family peptidase n=1 Tax=Marinicella meishanensis TaxID=2873263 RepID=UPI001CBB0B42|nr:S8 family peptidase [Marinicella sp. NBU2979]
MKHLYTKLALMASLAVQLPVMAQSSIGGSRPGGNEGNGIMGINDADVVPDLYLIKFSQAQLSEYNPEDKRGPTYKEFMIETAKNMASEYGGEMMAVYHHSVKGFLLKSHSRSAVESMTRDQRVAYIYADKETTLNNTQFNPTWGLDRVDQESLPLDQRYHYDLDGSGVNAYVFDTGTVNHADFNGRVSENIDFVTGSGGGLGGCDVVGPPPRPGIDPPTICFSDCNGHGTHVAGTIGSQSWGVAKNVNILPIRVLGCSNTGKVSDLIAGIEWLTENYQRPAVANISIGAAYNQPLMEAVEALIDLDIPVVVSAGNSNFYEYSQSPANVPDAITVAATNQNDWRWVDSANSGSNYGPVVDLFAPGEDILSADKNGGASYKTGTSMSAPHVAGAVALYLQDNPNATVAQVTDAILSGASLGKVMAAGTDTPNRLLNVTNLTGSEPVSEPDEYDDVSIRGYTDDNPGDAVVTYAGDHQAHNFHDAGDEDWIIFALGFNDPVSILTISQNTGMPNVGARLEAYRVDGGFSELGNGRYSIDEAGLTLVASSMQDGDNAVHVINDVSLSEVFVVKATSAGKVGADSAYGLSSSHVGALDIDEYDNVPLRGYTDNAPGDAVATFAGEMYWHTIHGTQDVDWSIFAIGPGVTAEFNIGGMPYTDRISVLKLEGYRLDGDYEDLGNGRWIIEDSDLTHLQTVADGSHDKRIVVHNSSNEVKAYLFKTSILQQGGHYKAWVEAAD